MIEPKCPVCLDLGWICENHPNPAWDPEMGCQCGAWPWTERLLSSRTEPAAALFRRCWISQKMG
jgi:hypothetical protein